MRKRRHTVSGNERWLVSYADYMTLMFAFFVVLYSISIVKEEEYSVLSDVLGNVFQATDGTGVTGEGILVNNELREGSFYGEKVLPESGESLVDNKSQLEQEEKVHLGAPLEVLEAELSTLFEQDTRTKLVTVGQNGKWLEIKLDSSLLFSSGSASLLSRSSVVLREISELLSQNSYKFRVRGFTDNQPINNELFQSNWYLSAARATAVVEQFQNYGIAPQRMAVEAFGEYSPEADNSTTEGRRENRSVVIAVSTDVYKPVEKQKSEEKGIAIPRSEVSIPDSDTINIVPLPHGGIRITTRQSETNKSDASSNEDADSDNK